MDISFDADSVEGSNDTYEFAGIDATQPEMLYTRTYGCVCSGCRDTNSINQLYTGCTYMATCGTWRQRTTFAKGGIAKKKNTTKVKVAEFAKSHLSKQALQQRGADPLFAAYSSYVERGGRPYWLLLKVLKPAWQTKKDGVCRSPVPLVFQ